MKNNLYKYLFIGGAAALLLGSCYDDLSKNDIDSKYVIDNSNCPVPTFTAIAAVSFDNAFLQGSVVPSEGQDEISEVGFLVSSDQTFDRPTSFTTSLGEDKTFSTKANKLLPETVYYAKAFVVTKGRAVQYSEMKEFTTEKAPDEQWEEVTTEAVFRDGVIPPSFDVPDPTILPDIVVEKMVGHEIYRMKDVFGADYPYNEKPEEYSESPFYIKIDCETYTKEEDVLMTAFIPEQDMGMNWGYGMFKIASLYGNVTSNLEKYPLGTFDKENGIFDLGSLGLFIDGYGWQPCTKTMLYLDPSKMVTDYENDYSYTLAGSGVFTSEALAESWKQNLLVALEDETILALPNLYAEGFPIFMIFNPADSTAKFPHDFETGLQFMDNDVYVSAQKGENKPKFDLINHVLHFNVIYYLADEEGNMITELKAASEVFDYTPVESEETQKPQSVKQANFSRRKYDFSSF